MAEHVLREVERLVARGEDPRMERTTVHQRRENIIRTICSVMRGAEVRVSIEECGHAAVPFFQEWLDVLLVSPDRN